MTVTIATDGTWRKTTQDLLPLAANPTPTGQYDIYPAFQLGAGEIGAGYAALAVRLVGHSRVIIDGYGGVFWSDFRDELDTELQLLGTAASWHNVAAALKQEAAIWQLTAPFLGGDDPLFGTRFTGELCTAQGAVQGPRRRSTFTRLLPR